MSEDDPYEALKFFDDTESDKEGRVIGLAILFVTLIAFAIAAVLVAFSIGNAPNFPNNVTAVINAVGGDR